MRISRISIIRRIEKKIKNRVKIGLTGGIGSGKTTVSNMFETLSAAIIDTDLIAHQLTARGGKAINLIVRSFGEENI